MLKTQSSENHTHIKIRVNQKIVLWQLRSK